jgi:hypothetical protein
MKLKNLIVLLVVAAALVALAFLSSRKQMPQEPDAIGKPVLPDLAVNDVARIAVRSATARTSVALEKDAWVVPDRYNYPADFSRIKDTLMKLADLKVGQVVRADEKQRAQLRLTMPPKEGGTNEAGTLVQLMGADGKELASLLVGGSHSRKASGPSAAYGPYPDGSYVSPDGGQTVYLVSEVLDSIPAAPREWMDSEMVNVQASDVMRVTVAATGRADVVLVRDEKSNQLSLTNLTDKEEMDTSKLYGVESCLSYLRFEDVADPTLTNEQLGMDAPSAVTVETRNGEIYTARIGAKDEPTGHRYVAFAVMLKPQPPVPPVAADETNAVKKAEAAEKAKQRAEQEKKTADLSARLSKWTYLCAAYKAEAMTPARDGLVKKKEEKKPEEPAKPEASAAGAGTNAAAETVKDAPPPASPPETTTNAAAGPAVAPAAATDTPPAK